MEKIYKLKSKSIALQIKVTSKLTMCFTTRDEDGFKHTVENLKTHSISVHLLKDENFI